MRRLGLLIPDDLDEALHRVSDRTGIPISTLIRNGIAEVLKSHGEEVAPKPIRRGGYRPRKDKPTNAPQQPKPIPSPYHPARQQARPWPKTKSTGAKS